MSGDQYDKQNCYTTTYPLPAHLFYLRAQCGWTYGNPIAMGLLALLNRWLGTSSFLSPILPSLAEWISRVNDSVQNGYGQYPLLAYGTDWLAFAHIVIAVAFIGPLRDPARNLWVIEFGMIACALIIPWALIFGVVRQIPLFWTFIDMSFGIFGIIPLWLLRRDILRISEEL